MSSNTERTNDMQNDKSKALIDSITDRINTLATMTDTTAKSDLFKTWLRAVSRFHHYSFNNQLLVLLQRPRAERVAALSQIIGDAIK